jgi:ZIP family zinc transporter
LGEEALGEAALYGLGTAVPLVAGALVGLRWQLPRAALAALMAFGAGTMIAAVTTELFAPAFEVSGGWRAGSALLAGTLVYVVADRLIEVRLGAAALGWALMLGALLDGIPENLALGATLEESGGVVLLVAIALGNTPEAISGAAKMRDQHGMSHRSAALIWAATGVVLVVVTIASAAVADQLAAETLSTTQAFAGGATIAVLADSLMPEAYREGGWWVGIATSLGFLLAFVLGG